MQRCGMVRGTASPKLHQIGQKTMKARDFTRVEDILGFKDRMVSTLDNVPGITDVTVFGSCADGRCDQFSDVDIHGTTIDIDLTLSRLYPALSRIDAVELEWPIVDAPEDWAATIVFEHLSPLQKLDLSIEYAPTGQSSGNQARTTTPVSNDLTGRPLTVYRPMIGSFEHYMLSQLLGTTRYVKARRRGHQLSCWRFASALVDAMIAIEYSGIADEAWVLATLTTQEYRDADLRLDPLLRSAVVGELNFTGPDAMDKTVVALVNKLVANYRARQSPIPIPDRLLRRLSGCTADLLE